MARGKHKSIPKELKKNINWLENQGAKIVIGLSECARHKYAPGTIKILSETAAGFKANAYSGNGVMNIFIVVKNDELRELVKEKFNNEQ
jgi:hypothetical protein